MATRNDPGAERHAADPEDHSVADGTSAGDPEEGARSAGDEVEDTVSRGDERSEGDEQSDRNDAGPPEESIVITDGGTLTSVDGGPSGAITADGGEAAGDDPGADDDETAGTGPELTGATLAGGLQDHLGLAVEPDAHLVDVPGHRALADTGALPGSAGGTLSSVAHDPVGFDRGSVVASPHDDERVLPDDGDPFGQRTDPFAGFDQVQGRPGSLYENPSVVGADREAEAAAAANPDLTGLVDMEGILGGQVGGTIDGRTPDGGAGGSTSGFVATSGYDPGNLLEGATSQGLTNPFAAANAVQKGVEQFGHGGFTVYDAHTGASIYGPGVSSGNGPSISAGSGPAGQYIIVQKGAEYQGGQLAPSSSSPLSAPVKTGGSEGVSPQGGESTHANEPFFQKLAAWVMQGSSSSPKAEALKQATQEIDAVGAQPTEAPERPDDGPENELPADPDAGGPPPAGLDLSREWAITVWAKDNADVNPNPMGDATMGGPAESMDISGFVEQYDEPQVAPTTDPDKLLQAHKDSIGEQFTEFEG